MSVEACAALIRRHLERASAVSARPPGSDQQADADSILLAEVMAAIEDEVGIEIPMDDTTAKALRSTEAFAALLAHLLAISEVTS